jgi:hypothetical protein
MRSSLLVLLAPVALFAACKPGDSATDTDGVTTTPAEAHLSLSPDVGGRGTTMDVHLSADTSAYRFGDTALDLGPGITIDTLTVQDGYNAVAQITIDPDAELTVRDAVIDIEGTPTTLTDAFTVIDESFRIDPSNAKMGETVQVAIVGSGTDWLEGYTWPGFGTDIDILDFSVLSPTLAQARLAVHPDARPGPRDVSMEDGPHVVTLYNGFTVDRAVVTAFFDPPQGYQGDTIEFTVDGLDTDFVDATDIQFWDDSGHNADIEITELHVLDSEHMYGRMHLSNAARIGMRDVLVAYNGESVLVPDAFEVLDAPPDLSNIYVGLGFDVDRQISNDDGSIAEQVSAIAYFLVPLDPPCGAPPPPAQGPMPYDQNGVFPSPPDPEPVDCPNPETVSAGDFVWFECPENIVTLDKDVIAATGQIIYVGNDLTLDDYHFDQLYDLHTQGDPDGIPEVTIPKVQPTVPADYYLLTPQFVDDFTQSRGEDFTYTWTPAMTYPDAFFITQISGTLAADGKPGFAGSIPWDDGVHTYTAAELSGLNAGPVGFGAVSHIDGPYFGLPFSTIQTCQSDSNLTTSAQMVLE